MDGLSREQLWEWIWLAKDAEKRERSRRELEALRERNALLEDVAAKARLSLDSGDKFWLCEALAALDKEEP